ncbi:hypothetical protein KYC5002_00100 [Archangium violaceum]|uniref:hypothetical protein n=1 Tax=Archangium violaceum TaxID=83451 RepID=UPI002B3093BC|nr:hypothetical protein KYC5002_00100 [Archangium gephyra]
MRKPTWWDLGIAVLGLVLVCSATQGVSLAQYPAAQYPEGQDPEGSVGDVTQDTRITGTSDGMGSDQGLPTGATTAQPGTGGSGVDAGQGTGGSGTGYTGQDMGTGTQQLSALETQQRVEIARLRAQVAGLEQQLAQMRVNLARVQAGQGTGVQGAGTGGSGTGSSAVGAPNAEAPTGATGIGYSTAEGVGGGGTPGTTTGTTTGTTKGTATNPSNEGYAVANVIHSGRVRSVTQQQLVLDEEDGSTSTLSLAKDVRVIQGRQQMSLKNLGEGTLVRTSADLYARGNPVTSIEVLSVPKKAASK